MSHFSYPRIRSPACLASVLPSFHAACCSCSQGHRSICRRARTDFAGAFLDAAKWSSPSTQIIVNRLWDLSILNLDSLNCFLFDVTWMVSDAGGKSKKWEQRNKAALTMTIDIDQDVFIGLWPAARLKSVVHETLGKRPWIFWPKCS